MQSNGQLQRICNNDSTHKESLEIPALTSNEYSSSVVTEPTCENDGIERYVLVVGGQEITVDYTLKAIGHDYGAPEYTWSENFMQCVAKRCCANDSAHVISENAIVTTSEEVKCSTDGYITYTATFGKSDFTIQQRTEYHAPADHTFSNTLSFDDTKHWHNCEFCSERTDENDHEYGEWQIEKEPSIFYKGLKKQQCLCGHVRVEEVPKKNFVKSIISGDLSFAEIYILVAIGVVVVIITIVILVQTHKKRKKKKA
jgi:hypothetical protein